MAFHDLPLPAQVLLPFVVLLLKYRAPAVYSRHREFWVFVVHLATTHLRAAVVSTMWAQAAVGYRTKRVQVGQAEAPSSLLIR